VAKKIVEITGMHKAFFTNSGAEATDGALKLARVRTGKKKFVAFTHGFHGRTVGSLAVTHKPASRSNRSDSPAPSSSTVTWKA
jgi:acetylornithine/N-succinyldiaminopimelate aminotransferase